MLPLSALLTTSRGPVARVSTLALAGREREITMRAGLLAQRTLMRARRDLTLTLRTLVRARRDSVLTGDQSRCLARHIRHSRKDIGGAVVNIGQGLMQGEQREVQLDRRPRKVSLGRGRYPRLPYESGNRSVRSRRRPELNGPRAWFNTRPPVAM